MRRNVASAKIVELDVAADQQCETSAPDSATNCRAANASVRADAV
jgi:hypothetical protein